MKPLKTLITLFTVLILSVTSSHAAEPCLLQLGMLPLEVNIHRMAVHETYAYLMQKVSDYSTRLIVIDFSDPAHPAEVARTEIMGEMQEETAVSLQYKRMIPAPNYAIEWPHFYFTIKNRLYIIDVRDPHNPVPLDFDWMHDKSFGNTIWGVRNQKMLVSEDLRESVRVDLADISDIASPQKQGSMNIVKSNEQLTLIWDSDTVACGFLTHERYRFATGEDLLLIDTQSSDAPRLIATYPLTGIKLLSQIGDTLYAVLYKNMRAPNRLQIFNLSDPENPIFSGIRELGYYLHDIYPFNDYALSMVSDDRLYISLFKPFGFSFKRIYDLPAFSNLILIQPAGQYLAAILDNGNADQFAVYKAILPAGITHFNQFH